jgi:hypothetical protein
MKASFNFILLRILDIFMLSSSAQPQIAGGIDTLTYFATQGIDTGGIAVTGDIDSTAAYFAVDSAFSDYNILALNLLLNPNIYRAIIQQVFSLHSVLFPVKLVI